MTDTKKTSEADKPEIKEIETSFPFVLKLENGTEEKIEVPRVTTRVKYRLGLNLAMNIDTIHEEDLILTILDGLIPEVMNRTGMKTPTMASLGKLTEKIMKLDGETILGKDWQKKLKPKKKRGRRKNS